MPFPFIRRVYFLIEGRTEIQLSTELLSVCQVPFTRHTNCSAVRCPDVWLAALATAAWFASMRPARCDCASHMINGGRRLDKSQQRSALGSEAASCLAPPFLQPSSAQRHNNNNNNNDVTRASILDWVRLFCFVFSEGDTSSTAIKMDHFGIVTHGFLWISSNSFGFRRGWKVFCNGLFHCIYLIHM